MSLPPSITVTTSLTSCSQLSSVTALQPHWLLKPSVSQLRVFALLFPLSGMSFTPFRCSLPCHPLHEASLGTLSKIATLLLIVPVLLFLISCFILFLIFLYPSPSAILYLLLLFCLLSSYQNISTMRDPFCSLLYL